MESRTLTPMDESESKVRGNGSLNVRSGSVHRETESAVFEGMEVDLAVY